VGDSGGFDSPKGLWVLLGALSALLFVGLAATLLLHGSSKPATASAAVPPPITVVVPPPQPAPADAKPIAPKPKHRKHKRDEKQFRRNERAQASDPWVASFYPIYATAQKTFGVSWLLLASIHKQETAFSTSRDTYFGLNFANCCAGPMQFNVTNGPVSTWARYGNAFRYAKRPKVYAHRTAQHPSVYDDFDSIMAAAALLRTSGANYGLDASAWRAAYDYYGHDLTGIDYADHVVARAIGWAQHGFSPNQGDDPNLVARVNAAYGAPLQAAALATR